MEKLKYKKLSQQTAYLFVFMINYFMIKYEFVFMCVMFEMTNAAAEHTESRFVHKHMINFFIQVVLHLQRVFCVIHVKYCTFKSSSKQDFILSLFSKIAL